LGSRRAVGAFLGDIFKIAALVAGFVASAAALVFATPVLRLIPWPSVLVANLLAAASMSAYFWRRHPRLVVRP